MKNLNLKNITLIILCFSIFGCGQLQLKSRTQFDYRDRHPITVNTQTASLIFDLAETVGYLRPDEETEIEMFAKNYISRGHGPIAVSMPESVATSKFVAELEQALIYEGIHINSIKYLPFPQNVEIIALTHRQYVARSTACSQTQRNRELSEQGSKNFGCAYQNNLAMQVKDPYDLVSPKIQSVSGDPQARQSLIERFRQGQSTNSANAKQTN